MGIGWSWKKRISKVGFALIVLVLIVIIDFPVYWMIKTSIESPLDFMSKEISLLPQSISFENYKNIWHSLKYASHIKFRDNMVNSFVVVGISTLVSLVIAIPAAYSLTRFKYRHKESIAQGILYVYMFPQMILLIPLLILVSRLGLYNTLTSLIIVYCTFSLPYSIWMLRGYFLGLPPSLEEAAMIDGCTRLEAFRRITLPLASPGLVATAIYCFILGWDNVIYPLTFITYEHKKVLSIGFLSLISGDVTPWGGVMAASVITAIPVMILFWMLQRAIVQGMTAGAIKQ
ncbi:MAG: N,N-diacetylchitobiose transport system permease protein [Candidatus Atribacteria bacterium]|nr:N,N-diacetylchitobiose transport system permease protein [Candidatus Atribacteria bacterium]